MTFPSHHESEHLYFITATLCGWRHLFVEPAYTQTILDSLSWLRLHKRINLFAFVVMPSHLHTIVKPIEIEIGKLLQQFGSYTAHAILSQLRQGNRQEDINFFHRQKRDIRHNTSIWQDIQAKNIFSPAYLQQKLEYIHNNPVDHEWNLANDRVNYVYSSACYYDRGIQPIIEIDDVRSWM